MSPLLNLRPYQQVLSDRRAVAFSLAGFVARLPMSMTGIGIVLLVSLTTGSFGLAGLLTAATTVAAAVVAPFWGRATDRVGQARVLILTVLINVCSVALLVTAIELAWPLALSFAIQSDGRTVVVLSRKLIGSSVRPSSTASAPMTPKSEW